MNESRRYLSMLSDFGFKRTFGNQHQTEFLRRALQALIASQTPIERVTFGRNEVSALTPEGRGGLFDIVCQDERGRTFIVEMQLTQPRHFIQRAKFYAFHKFNTLVRRGEYRFDDLTPIYAVSLLAGQTYPTQLYHQIVTLQNQRGELVDDQITHVVVELDKFNKAFSEVDNDLDKLLFTMKTTHQTNRPAQRPGFFDEAWLAEALRELDSANLTPEQRMQYEMTIAGNVSDREAIRAEVREEVAQEVREEVAQEVREEAIARMVRIKTLTDQQIAEVLNVNTERVRAVRATLS
ncbi:MAG: Rpn family recombination-promoting nuclease/putative transposase [Catalinimonas sp.]